MCLILWQEKAILEGRAIAEEEEEEEEEEEVSWCIEANWELVLQICMLIVVSQNTTF